MNQFSSVAQSCPTLWPHELQHARPLCPSPTPRVCSNSCPSSWWCHLAISSSVTLFLRLPSIPPSIRVFSSESALCIRWPKYWSFSFSINPSVNTQGWLSRNDLFNECPFNVHVPNQWPLPGYLPWSSEEPFEPDTVTTRFCRWDSCGHGAACWDPRAS